MGSKDIEFFAVIEVVTLHFAGYENRNLTTDAEQASSQVRRAPAQTALVPTALRARLLAREVLRRATARMNAREDTRGLQTHALRALPESTRQDPAVICVRHAGQTLTVVRARQSASATLATPWREALALAVLRACTRLDQETFHAHHVNKVRRRRRRRRRSSLIIRR